MQNKHHFCLAYGVPTLGEGVGTKSQFFPKLQVEDSPYPPHDGKYRNNMFWDQNLGDLIGGVELGKHLEEILERPTIN